MPVALLPTRLPSPLAPSGVPDMAADDACYRALQAHDARFDGRFFTGVTSTGIYCRPVCAVRTPQRAHCRFFALAAQAEAAGFRPCLRCRPELAPQALVWSVQDARGILVREALRLLSSTEPWNPSGTPGETDVARLALRLGVSDRHLRRIFAATLGISPLQYRQTQRLLCAKQLLTDTALPIAQVALASGFASVRRFNAVFSTHYGLRPSAVRGTGAVRPSSQGAVVRLGYRPPLDAPALLAFFAQRQIHGVESVPPGPALTLRRTVRLEHTTGWISAQFEPARNRLLLHTSDSLLPALPQVIARVRALFDLDADPGAIDAVLHEHFAQGAGLRVPGAWDGFELAVRAVLGQQITVAAARTLAQRLVERFGEPTQTPWADLARLFPTPGALARADGDALGQLGIVRQRQAAIVALARAMDSGQLQLHSGADVAATTAQLCQLPGIGDWTAQYIAMRALRWPDAFPAGDVALHKALGMQAAKNPARAATQAAQAWQPWRSYAVIRAWAGCHRAAPDTEKLSNQ